MKWEPVTYISVCSGIEAASVASDDLGWKSVGFAEIDRAASKVLAHRFGSNMPGEPLARNGVPNFGDFTTIDPKSLDRVDLLIGGPPCQAFSIAGKRLSLADARGNLSLSYAVLAHELARHNGLQGCLWENVPGVLSTKDNAFGCFLGALVGADHAVAGCDRPRRGQSNWFWNWNAKEESHVTRWPSVGMVAGPRARLAWRVLDAQYFGLAQRRERVFVVASFGDAIDPAEILFERKGLHGDSPPRREAGQSVTGTLESGANCTGGTRPPGTTVDTAEPGAKQQAYVAFDLRGREGGAQFEGPHETANIRAASGGSSRSYVATEWAVRRLTPTECERLQGFPDGWTAIPGAADGPRYKQLGNSMAVNVMAWIERRIDRALAASVDMREAA